MLPQPPAHPRLQLHQQILATRVANASVATAGTGEATAIARPSMPMAVPNHHIVIPRLVHTLVDIVGMGAGNRVRNCIHYKTRGMQVEIGTKVMDLHQREGSERGPCIMCMTERPICYAIMAGALAAATTRMTTGKCREQVRVTASTTSAPAAATASAATAKSCKCICSNNRHGGGCCYCAAIDINGVPNPDPAIARLIHTLVDIVEMGMGNRSRTCIHHKTCGMQGDWQEGDFPLGEIGLLQPGAREGHNRGITFCNWHNDM